MTASSVLHSCTSAHSTAPRTSPDLILDTSEKGALAGALDEALHLGPAQALRQGAPDGIDGPIHSLSVDLNHCGLHATNTSGAVIDSADSMPTPQRP